MLCSEDTRSLPKADRHITEGNIKPADRMKGALYWMKGEEAASIVCGTGMMDACLCPVRLGWRGRGRGGGAYTQRERTAMRTREDLQGHPSPG